MGKKFLTLLLNLHKYLAPRRDGLKDSVGDMATQIRACRLQYASRNVSSAFSLTSPSLLVRNTEFNGHKVSS